MIYWNSSKEIVAIDIKR